MLLAMSDASVLVDMAQTKLLSPMTRLPYEIVAPDFVIEEITRQEETRAIDALVRGNKLTVLTATRDGLRRGTTSDASKNCSRARRDCPSRTARSWYLQSAMPQ